MTPHFTIDELTHSQKASRLGLDNTPPAWVMPNLQRLANGLEQVRSLTGKPISVSSGYRSEELEKVICDEAYRAWCKTKRLVIDDKSWATYFASKQHPTGNAADITCPGFGITRKLVEAIVKSDIDFDQCILEYAKPDGSGGWCHVSFTHKPRKMALVIDGLGKRAFA